LWTCGEHAHASDNGGGGILLSPRKLEEIFVILTTKPLGFSKMSTIRWAFSKLTMNLLPPSVKMTTTAVLDYVLFLGVIIHSYPS
jgi:hypothetical protein